jgi:hypothetical protein
VFALADPFALPDAEAPLLSTFAAPDAEPETSAAPLAVRVASCARRAARRAARSARSWARCSADEMLPMTEPVFTEPLPPSVPPTLPVVPPTAPPTVPPTLPPPPRICAEAGAVIKTTAVAAAANRVVLIMSVSSKLAAGVAEPAFSAENGPRAHFLPKRLQGT